MKKMRQFTGLHDRNGKEIWEGDIIKQEFWLCGRNQGTFIGQVVYRAPAFAVMFEQNFKLDLICTGRYCEVIGNVFENPELLEQS